jgi:predicted enzyme related to lactoylglutathione lyase
MMNDAMKQHGAFSWNELMTSDVSAAKTFYASLLGWSIEDMTMENGMIYTVVKAGGKEVGGIMATPAESAGMPPQWGAYVTVDDVDASALQAQQLGGKLLLPAQDIPSVGRFCVIQDPQGATLSLITYEKQ